MNSAPALCVDLDGTLIKTDMLFESFLWLVKKNPMYLFLVLYWAIFGIAHLKHEIASRVVFNPACLPFSKNFLAYLREEKSKGRYIALVTAANYQIAKPIAEYLNIFSEVIASDKTLNVKGSIKQNILQSRFGNKQYAYCGNDHHDLPVWETANQVILVNPSKKINRLANKIFTVEKVFFEKKINLLRFLEAIRVHQYVKNLLVFVPMFVGHFVNPTAIINSFLAFFVFCCFASSAYILNDLLDLSSDRQHVTKCHRAFASGDMPIVLGLFLSPAFLGVGFFLASGFSVSFIGVMTLYYLLTILYSLYLKQIVLIDVFVLSILYTLRVIGGIAAIDSLYSPWLIAFALFFFLSLAFVKRFSELEDLKIKNKTKTVGRGYLVTDLFQLQLFGTASGYISVFVLALYINSDQVNTLYRYSQCLWLICLILLYWISRTWLLAARGLVHDDPVLFALKDKVSLGLAVCIVIIVIGSSIH